MPLRAVQVPRREEDDAGANALKESGPDGAQGSLHGVERVGVDDVGDDVHEGGDEHGGEIRVGAGNGLVDELGTVGNYAI